jgi:hypothetical protein
MLRNSKGAILARYCLLTVYENVGNTVLVAIDADQWRMLREPSCVL